ncbi:MAG: tetratricopeptide repeat protein [Bacteroidia bacterium]
MMKNCSRIVLFIVAMIPFYGLAEKSTELASLIRSLKSAATDSAKASIHNSIAYEYMHTNDDSVRSHAGIAMKLAAKANVLSELSRSYTIFGTLNVSNGNTDSAYSCYTKALTIDAARHYSKNLIDDYMHIAKTYASRGSIDKAIDFLVKGIDLAKKTGDKEQEAECLFRLAVIYDRQDQSDKAITFCENAITLQTEIRDSAGLAYSHHRLGLAYEGIKNYDLALKHLELSYEIRKRIGAKAQFGASLNGIGLVYMDKGEFQKALIKFYDAYKSWSEAGDKEGIVIATGNLGELSMRMGDDESALKYFLQSGKIAEQIHALSFEKGTLRSLATLYYKKGQYKTAYDYFSRFSDLRDTLFSDENADRMAQMQSKYESEQKEQQIELLRKENQLRNSELLLRDSELGKKKIFVNALAVGGILLLLLAFMIYNRYRLKQRANEELQEAHIALEQNRDILAVKNKEVTDSIKYAKRLQQAILPGDQMIHSLLPDSFVFYKPKDIVSGDFYWFEKAGEKILFAAVDCTGHGVPGAFMSIVGYNLLNQAVNEQGITQPNKILNSVNRNITKTLRQSEEDSVVKDGMDIALCAINADHSRLEYSGAYNSLWLIRNRELIEYKADKYPIGLFVGENLQEFTHREIELEKGDLIYVFTDGFADQFGGPKGKKFKYKQLQQLLLDISQKKMSEQKKILDATIEEWKGRLEQVDDILIIGVRIG